MRMGGERDTRGMGEEEEAVIEKESKKK